jgi:hypothetical protein
MTLMRSFLLESVLALADRLNDKQTLNAKEAPSETGGT